MTHKICHWLVCGLVVSLCDCDESLRRAPVVDQSSSAGLRVNAYDEQRVPIGISITRDAKTLRALVEHPNASTVRFVEMDNPAISSSDLDFLRKLPVLEVLHFKHMELTGAGLPVIPTLLELEITVETLDSNAAQAIARNTSLQSLKILTHEIGDVEVRTLCELPNLRELHLDRVHVSDAAVAAISTLNKLKVVSLAGTNVTARAIADLASNLQLESLDLSQTPITESSIPVLYQMPRLKTLHLRQCDLSDKAVSSLWSAPALVSLDISGVVGLTNKCLYGIEGCKSIQKLSISGPGFNDDALETLARIDSLKSLFLDSTSATSAGFLRLRESRPDLHFYGQAVDDDGTVAKFAVAEQKAAIALLEQSGATLTLDRDKYAVQVSLSDQVQPAQVLKHLGKLPTITDVFFNGCPVQGEDLGKLKSLPKLNSLTFVRCQSLDDSGLAHLSELSAVTHLTLRDCRTISAAGITHLSRMGQLQHLELHKLQLADDVFEGIAKLHSLRKLYFYDVPISGSGIQKLHQLPILETLVLRGCPIQQCAAEAIAEVGSLKSVTLGKTTSESFAPHDLSSIVSRLRQLRKDLEILQID